MSEQSRAVGEFNQHAEEIREFREYATALYGQDFFEPAAAALGVDPETIRGWMGSRYFGQTQRIPGELRAALINLRAERALSELRAYLTAMPLAEAVTILGQVVKSAPAKFDRALWKFLPHGPALNAARIVLGRQISESDWDDRPISGAQIEKFLARWRD